MGIIRVAKNSNYVVMNRTALNDNQLSWKAKGIMAYMLSMPDDWVFYMDELMTHSTDGKASFRAGFNELKECGYIERKPIREGQRIKEWETIVHEVPINSLLTDFQEVEKQEIENQEVGFQEVENRTLLSTDNNQVLNKSNTDNNQVLTEREGSQSSNPLVNPNFESIKQLFESNVRIATLADCNNIHEALEYYEPSLIFEAINAGANNARSFKYILSILDNWRKELGVKTYADWQVKIDAATKRSNGGNHGQAQSQKPSVFGDYCSD